MVTPAAKRKAVAHLRTAFDMSERRACRTIDCMRMTVRYRSRRPDDTELRQRLRALAHERRRFGYRRLHVLLRREGFTVNHKRLFRLYREEGLTVRRRGGRKRALGTRAPMLVPQLPNERWSLDFVADQFNDGRRLRILGRGRRLQPRMLGARSRHLDLRCAGRPRTRPAADRSRHAEDDCLRQRHRTDLERHPAMGGRSQGGLALHRAGQARAECLCQVLHRPLAGRVAQ